MNTKKLPGLLTFGLLIMTFIVAGQFVTAQSNTTTLIAYNTSDTITLDGDASESVWSDAEEILVPDIESSGIEVTVKAVNDGTYLYVYATWTDSTESNTRKGWSFNGTSWTNVGGNEDRISFAWSVGDNDIVCGHNPGTSDDMLFDIWHFKATRTAPAGWVDDKFWDGSGRHSDAKTAGGYSDNSVVAQAADSAAITTALGNTSEVAAFSNDDRPFWDANGDPISWSNGVNSTPMTDFISGYKTVVPTGSRGDVLVGSNHDGLAWHVEFKRALDTGNTDDDVTFTEDSAVPFYLAVHDNAGDDGHYRAGGATPIEFSLTVSSDSATTTTTPPPGGLDFTLIAAAGAVGIVVLVALIWFFRRS